jgi:hypothetical protein
MSLINVFLNHSRALVTVDTQGYDAIKGELVDMGKILHFPHTNTLMAVRGDHSFGLVLYTLLSQTYEANNFDSLVKLIPEKFKAAHQALVVGRANLADVDQSELDKLEIMLVGWSHQANRMRAVLFQQIDQASGIKVIEVEEPGYIIPWEDRWGEPPEGENQRFIVETAMAQVKNAKRDNPNTPIGGRILLAELTRHNMSFSTSGFTSIAAAI